MINRIPPPFLTLMLIVLMIFLAVQQEEYTFHLDLGFYIGVAFVVLGCAIMISAVLGFRHRKTTVNPFRPDKSSALVIDGLYEYTRNPMYLGMAFMLLGVQIALGYAPNILWVILFVIYMTQYQIKPEERALTKIFGGEFTAYMQKVRRWL